MPDTEEGRAGRRGFSGISINDARGIEDETACST
jgi:hypothetical protein